MTLALAVLEFEGRVMIERRSPQGLLAGLWAFPEREVVDRDSSGSVVPSIAEDRDLTVVSAPERLPEVEHRFTHLHATYVPWRASVAHMRERPGRAWVFPGVPGELAVPRAQARVLETLAD